MQRFVIVIEHTATGFSAESPDPPRGVASGASRADVERLMREAIEVPLAGLRADGRPTPREDTFPPYLAVAA